MSADPDRLPIIAKIDQNAPPEFRWCATYGEPDLDCQIGWGATREDAIADLTEWADEDNIEPAP